MGPEYVEVVTPDVFCELCNDTALIDGSKKKPDRTR
jgi:hypothetical protein